MGNNSCDNFVGHFSDRITLRYKYLLMIIGSIKENLTSEKRVSITPETAKNIINLGLKVIIENNYATHIGITDKEYELVGVEIKSSKR